MNTAIDSLLAGLQAKPGLKTLLQFEGDSFFHDLWQEKLRVIGLDLIENDKGSGTTPPLTVAEIMPRINELQFRYPKATRRTPWSPRVVQRTALVSVGIKWSKGDSIMFKNEYTFNYTDEFEEKYLNNVQGQHNMLRPEIEDYTIKYYLWEPVLVSAAAITLTFLFFSNR
ncbi:hypothetical protein JW877_00475 [bacterium]|nr:hypothetical protein [bacterium]